MFQYQSLKVWHRQKLWSKQGSWSTVLTRDSSIRNMVFGHRHHKSTSACFRTMCNRIGVITRQGSLQIWSTWGAAQGFCPLLWVKMEATRGQYTPLIANLMQLNPPRWIANCLEWGLESMRLSLTSSTCTTEMQKKRRHRLMIRQKRCNSIESLVRI